MAQRYVNMASTAGGDGTTNNTSGATRAYASSSAWEAARQAVLTEVEECICEGTAADTTNLVIDGWTTTAAFYIDLKAVAGAGRHAGVWSTSHYRIASSNDFGAALLINEAYVRVTGLQVENTSADGAYCVRYLTLTGTTATTDFRMDGCILRDADGAGGNAAGFEAEDGLIAIRNTVSYGHGGAGFYFIIGDSVSLGVTVTNCIAANNTGLGFNCATATGTNVLQNCYSGGNTGADISANWDTITTCRSEDGSQGTTVVAYSTSAGTYFTNITAGSEDFHIGASSSLLDIGTDYSGTFTTDIDGETRTGTWDIGADERVSAAVGILRQMMQHHH